MSKSTEPPPEGSQPLSEPEKRSKPEAGDEDVILRHLLKGLSQTREEQNAERARIGLPPLMGPVTPIPKASTAIADKTEYTDFVGLRKDRERHDASPASPITTPPKPPAATSPKASAKKLTDEEQKVIDWLEKSKGRKLTKEEINLSLEQAREIGELPRTGRRVQTAKTIKKPLPGSSDPIWNEPPTSHSHPLVRKVPPSNTVFAERPSKTVIKSQFFEEALNNSLFSQLWACEKDTAFRPYACAIFAFAEVSRLSADQRAALYREIATAKRAELLDRLSGLNGWKKRIRLLSKTRYRLFDEKDWRALFLVSEDLATRRGLGHMQEITPVLLHQVRLVPELIRLPNVFSVLNRLRISATYWQQLANALTETPPEILPSLMAKAKGVASIGSFWDYFFECVDKPWGPFDLPEKFLLSPMLKPLKTIHELESEGLKMKNCLASHVTNVQAGRMVYFSWQGDQPATVQFVRTTGWHLGRILGPQNQPLPLAEVTPIRCWAELLLAGEPDDGAVPSDRTDVTILSLCSRARHKFSVGDRDPLAAALREIRGKTQGLGPGTSAFCIFECKQGHIQFMADVDSHEYLCEVQSHHYVASMELRLTNKIVSLLADSGFRWPRGRENFSRWFTVSTEADVERLAEYSLGILNEIFGHKPGSDLDVTVHLP
jgi:hypothetical protein